ncbi:hypothetical protein LguiA_033734 [Lonicera macranthoides]
MVAKKRTHPPTHPTTKTHTPHTKHPGGEGGGCGQYRKINMRDQDCIFFLFILFSFQFSTNDKVWVQFSWWWFTV